MEKYLYESHMGGVYATTEPIPWDSLYCDTCGDSDWELGVAASRAEARKLLKEQDYTKEYIQEFLDKEFPKKTKKPRKRQEKS